MLDGGAAHDMPEGLGLVERLLPALLRESSGITVPLGECDRIVGTEAKLGGAGAHGALLGEGSPVALERFPGKTVSAQDRAWKVG